MDQCTGSASPMAQVTPGCSQWQDSRIISNQNELDEDIKQYLEQVVHCTQNT